VGNAELNGNTFPRAK